MIVLQYHYGFAKDGKKHAIDLRVIYKEGDLILRIKDNCEAFDPAACREMMDPKDLTKNIGIRMVFNVAKSVSYQSVLGLNVLIITI